jgi:hypothetical protein
VRFGSPARALGRPRRRPTAGRGRFYVQNDGNTTDDITIQGTGPLAPFFKVVGYRLLVAVDGSNPWTVITTDVVAGTFTLEDVLPGGEAKIQLAVNVGKGAPVGTQYTLFVTARSGNDPTKTDTARAIMRAS